MVPSHTLHDTSRSQSAALMPVTPLGGRRPRILYVSETWTHGARVRCLSILEALRQIGTVAVATLVNSGVNCDSVIGSRMEGDYSFETHPKPNTKLLQKLKFTLDPATDYPYGLGVSNSGHERLVRIVQEFDLIWFFKQRSADMFPNARWRCSVVDIDDVQSTYEQTLLQLGKPTDRLRALRAFYVWRRRERLLDGRFDVLTVCTEEDKDYLHHLGVRCPIHVIPNGFQRPRNKTVRTPATPPRLGFIGGFDHFPNREGMTWFLKHCWPQIKCDVPEARLRVIGRDGAKLCDIETPDVDCLGWVPTPSDEIKTWAAMVVPIRVGAGTRVKIAQGFSEMCPIVSTSFGALGYGAIDGCQMYLADSAKAFSRACIRAICEPEEASRVAQRAWTEFLQKWTWEALFPRVWAAAEDCLRLNACFRGSN